jgi:hypothetical protein
MAILIVWGYPRILSAQENTWRVELSSGNTLSDCKVQLINDSLLMLDCGSTMLRIPIDSVVVLSRHKESTFWTGAGWGTLTGATIGALLGWLTSPTHAFIGSPAVNAAGDGILGGLGGFVVGGIIGASNGGDETYRLSERTRHNKIFIIHFIMEEN